MNYLHTTQRNDITKWYEPFVIIPRGEGRVQKRREIVVAATFDRCFFVRYNNRPQSVLSSAGGCLLSTHLHTFHAMQLRRVVVKRGD